MVKTAGTAGLDAAAVFAGVFAFFAGAFCADAFPDHVVDTVAPRRGDDPSLCLAYLWVPVPGAHKSHDDPGQTENDQEKERPVFATPCTSREYRVLSPALKPVGLLSHRHATSSFHTHDFCWNDSLPLSIYSLTPLPIRRRPPCQGSHP